MPNNKVMVSVACMAYNHEKYIRQALDSILSQETDFEFEILVHDDASTDGTAEIVSEYAAKYSNIIPIIEEENIYSQGYNVVLPLLRRARGKYMIVLECDDFWLDHSKLQKQVEYMENHPEMSACAHQTLAYNVLSGKTWLMAKNQNDCNISLDDVIKRNNVYHLSSMLFRTDIYNKFFECMKNVEWLYTPGEYAMEIFFLFYGKVHYFDEIMTFYRRYSSESSWTYQYHILDKNESINRKMLESTIRMFRIFDEWTSYKYHRLMERAISSRIFALNDYKCELKDLNDRYMRKYFIYEMPIRKKMYVVLSNTPLYAIYKMKKNTSK
ncbi:MAG: glycosyltransferase [Butyrivibrio sp.]|uniref:glycosyltransferase family 2 protein n=1 Tax=Butyrivibrio sp. TaxID=28121 RepID=UPI0025C29942|nr:glycosyltransferase [Butyrivibrio sp.]MBQ6587179.1 glycosyltransferase [Butyrivibrio sp.]